MYPNVATAVISDICHFHCGNIYDQPNPAMMHVLRSVLDEESRYNDVNFSEYEAPSDDDEHFNEIDHFFHSLDQEYDESNTTISLPEEEENVDFDEKVETLVKVKNEKPNLLVYSLMEIVPDACPQFLRKLCKGKEKSDAVVDELLNELLSTDYPKRRKRTPSPQPTLSAVEQLEMLKSLLPDADPKYLEAQISKFEDNPVNFNKWVSEVVEHRNYPTLKEAQRKEKVSAQIKQYTVNFDPEVFLEVIPDPKEHFFGKNRKNHNVVMNAVDKLYALNVLKNYFNQLPIKLIQMTFNKYDNPITTWIALTKTMKISPSSSLMRTKRKPVTLYSPPENIPLLQEVIAIIFLI